VVLFGSLARGEATERSDIDLFVVVRKLPDSAVERRFIVYDCLTPLLKRFRRGVTVVEADEEDLRRRLSPLLINIAHEGITLYDAGGAMSAFLKRIRDAVRAAGLEKYETSNGKYGWKPRGELSKITVQGYG
jgi:predicted nucleotidyltransferase